MDRQCGLCWNCGKLLRTAVPAIFNDLRAPAFQTNVAKEWASTVEDLSMKGWFKNERQQVLTWNPTPRFFCSRPCGGSFLIPDLFRPCFCDLHFGWSIHVEVIWTWSPLQLQQLPCDFLGDVFWGKGYQKTTHISPRYLVFFGSGMGYLMPWELATFIFRGHNTYAVFVGSFNPHVSWVLESKGRWSYVKKTYFKRNSNTSKVFMPQASPPKLKETSFIKSSSNYFVHLAKVPPPPGPWSLFCFIAFFSTPKK